jgi:predicted aspartyl protease
VSQKWRIHPGKRRRDVCATRGFCYLPAMLGWSRMSLFKVSVVARNTKDESLATAPLEALVDSGSELTWLPRDVLFGIQIISLRKRSFVTLTQQRVSRETGYAILSAEGFETVDEVVFAEPGDMTRLGVRTLEGFGVLVDNVAHRFVANRTIAAVAGLELAA